MTITKEDFDAWLAHPVTEDVFRAMDRLGEQAERMWHELSWIKGRPDPLMLADYRARAEVVRDFRRIDFETLEQWLSDEKPERNKPD